MSLELSKKEEALIRSLGGSHGRGKHSLCICEGRKPCAELLALRPDLIVKAVCSDDFDASSFKNLDFARISPPRFAALARSVNPQGVLFLANRPEVSEEAGRRGRAGGKDDFIVYLDGVSDPGNLGTIIRTVRALGLRELCIGAGTADPYADKVIRAATASQFALDIHEFAGFAEAVPFFAARGCSRYFITDPHRGGNIFKEKNVFKRSVIIFGNEAHGAKDFPGAEQLTIPMPGGIESINVAQAATVVLFEYVRRRLP